MRDIKISFLSLTDSSAPIAISKRDDISFVSLLPLAIECDGRSAFFLLSGSSVCDLLLEHIRLTVDGDKLQKLLDGSL